MLHRWGAVNSNWSGSYVQLISVDEQKRLTRAYSQMVKDYSSDDPQRFSALQETILEYHIDHNSKYIIKYDEYGSKHLYSESELLDKMNAVDSYSPFHFIESFLKRESVSQSETASYRRNRKWSSECRSGDNEEYGFNWSRLVQIKKKVSDLFDLLIKKLRDNKDSTTLDFSNSNAGKGNFDASLCQGKCRRASVNEFEKEGEAKGELEPKLTFYEFIKDLRIIMPIQNLRSMRRL